jgi:hypothetical protein
MRPCHLEVKDERRAFDYDEEEVQRNAEAVG